MANQAKTTSYLYRQAKGVWEVKCIIPDEFRDKMAAEDIAENPEESILSKIPRLLPMQIGTQLIDEKFEYLWEVVQIRGYVQRVASRKQGKAPIVWLKLISLTPDR